MIIKQGFKFLDMSSFCCEDMAMLFIRQSYKVSRTIIIPYPIKMMHYPAIRQGLIVSFLPNQDVLTDISSFIRSGMFRAKNLDISSYLTSTTFIYCISYSSFTRTNCYLISTRLTMLRPVINEFTTGTLFPMSQTALFALLQLLYRQ